MPKRNFNRNFASQLGKITASGQHLTDSTSILQLAIKDVRGEVLLHALEKHNIIIGTGSACAGRKESLYKKSLEIPDVYKNGIVRLSISSFNNIDEIQYVVAKIADEVKGLRV